MISSTYQDTARAGDEAAAAVDAAWRPGGPRRKLAVDGARWDIRRRRGGSSGSRRR